MNDKGQAKTLIARYQQNIYALVLYLIGADQDVAYEICAASFAETLSGSSPTENEETFFNKLIRAAVTKSRTARALPVSHELEFLDLSRTEKGPLRAILGAFQTLDFDEKAFILLRDQTNRSYKDIAVSMGISESSARQKTIQARIRFREKLEEAVNGE